jgi:hypothetical protein
MMFAVRMMPDASKEHLWATSRAEVVGWKP